MFSFRYIWLLLAYLRGLLVRYFIVPHWFTLINFGFHTLTYCYHLFDYIVINSVRIALLPKFTLYFIKSIPLLFKTNIYIDIFTSQTLFYILFLRFNKTHTPTNVFTTIYILCCVCFIVVLIEIFLFAARHHLCFNLSG